MPDPSSEDLDKSVNKIITQRFENIGIWDQTSDRLEATRANNKLINDIRLARDARTTIFGKSLFNIFLSLIGQILWVIGVAVVMWLIQYFRITGKIP